MTSFWSESFSSSVTAHCTCSLIFGICFLMPFVKSCFLSVRHMCFIKRLSLSTILRLICNSWFTSKSCWWEASDWPSPGCQYNIQERKDDTVQFSLFWVCSKQIMQAACIFHFYAQPIFSSKELWICVDFWGHYMCFCWQTQTYNASASVDKMWFGAHTESSLDQFNHDRCIRIMLLLPPLVFIILNFLRLSSVCLSLLFFFLF